MDELRATLRRTRAFTLVELLIVIVVLAVLAAIAIPKFADSGSRSKDSSLKSDLQIVRSAVDQFKTDTGAYPAALADLTSSTTPGGGKDAAGNAVPFTPTTPFHGPYLAGVPTDPVANNAPLNYTTAPNGTAVVGTVTTTATGNDSSGNPYSGY